jgi:hypothetical protein
MCVGHSAGLREARSAQGAQGAGRRWGIWSGSPSPSRGAGGWRCVQWTHGELPMKGIAHCALPPCGNDSVAIELVSLEAAGKK